MKAYPHNKINPAIRWPELNTPCCVECPVRLSNAARPVDLFARDLSTLTLRNANNRPARQNKRRVETNWRKLMVNEQTFKHRPLYTAVMAGTLVMAGAATLATNTSIAADNNQSPQIVLAANACNPCAVKKVNPCAAKACNPCAAKACNPCAAKACNPCAAKACNPCAAKACNPCAAKACNPSAVKACNPCAAKACNPCAANACKPCNPCGAGKIKAEQFVRPAALPFNSDNIASQAALGKRLWNDTTLSTNGLACQSCHNGGALLNATFANPYPHEVAMPKQMAGVNSVDIDEMVNFCMLAPMAAQPLQWNSMELVALSAYSLELQASFNPCAAKAANPCAANACNPCAAKACNPCAAKACNPCAAKACNPCAAKACNPCAAKACNPCAAKACNPCAAKACNPCAAKACNPCAAKACNPCAAKACNPCAAKN